MSVVKSLERILFLFSFFLLLALALPSPAGATPPPDPGFEEVVYVVNSFGHTYPNPDQSGVSLLRGRSLVPIDTVTLVPWDSAHTVALNQDQTRLWVTCPGENVICFLHAITMEVLDTINLGDIEIEYPIGAACTPDGTEMWITYSRTGRVGIYDPDTAVWIETISVGSHPDFIVFTADGTKAYLVDYQNSAVVAVRTSDRTVLATIDLEGHALQDAVLSPGGNFLFVSNMDMDRIDVIRTSTNAYVDSLPTDERPRGIAISPDGDYLFVGNYTIAGGTVSMIRLSDQVVVDTLVGLSNPRRFALRDDGSRLFVAEHNDDLCVAINVVGEDLRWAASYALNQDFPGMSATPVGIALAQFRQPLPDIKINGLDGPVTLSRSETLTLSIAVDANGRSDDSEYWLVGVPPGGWPSNIWYWTPAGWSRTLLPLYEGPIYSDSLTSPPVPLTTVPPGLYAFGLFVDINRDGFLGVRSSYFDAILLTVTP